MDDGPDKSTAPERSQPALHVHQAHYSLQLNSVVPLQESVAELALRGHLPVEGVDVKAIAQVDGSSLLLLQPDLGEQLFHLQLFFTHVSLSEQDDAVTGKPAIVLQTVEVASTKRESRPTFVSGDVKLELHSSTSQYVCRQCLQRGLSGVRWSSSDNNARNVCLSCAPLKEPAKTWLFVVDGDKSDAKAFISIMAAAGAIQQNPQAEYQIQTESCGVGSTATVHIAERHDGSCNQKFVIKIFNSTKHDTLEKELNALRPELSTLSTVQAHPNIVHFYGVYLMDLSDFKRHTPDQLQPKTSTSAWCVVMNHCRGGDLFDAVKKHRFSEDRARPIMVGIFKALSHIHDRGIVHRDVKPENVLLAHDGRAVLTDFGISCRVSDEIAMARKCGSPGYVAPEVLCGKASSTCIDTFSSGSLLFFLISGKIPFYGSSISSILSRTIKCEVDFKKNPHMNIATQRCKDFVAALLCKKYKHRPTAQLALSNPWVLNVTAPDPQQDDCAPDVSDTGSRQLPCRPPGMFFRQDPEPDATCQASGQHVQTAAQNISDASPIRPPGKFFRHDAEPDAIGQPPGQHMHIARRNVSDASMTSTNESSTSAAHLDAADRRDTFTSSIASRNLDTASFASSMLRDTVFRRPSRASSKEFRTDRTDDMCSSADSNVGSEPYYRENFGSTSMTPFSMGLVPRVEGMRFFPDRAAPQGAHGSSTPTGSVGAEYLSGHSFSSRFSCFSADVSIQSARGSLSSLSERHEEFTTEENVTPAASWRPT